MMFCSVFQIGFIFLVSNVKYSFVEEQKSSPNYATTAVGSDVRLNCLIPGSRGHWIKYAEGFSSEISSPQKGIHYKYRERFSIANGSIADLVIRNVSSNDIGQYRCINVDNEDYQYLLIVLGNDLRCNVSVDPDENASKFCGPFTSISVTCEISYYGEVPPTIRWTKRRGDKDETIASDYITVNFPNSFVLRSTVQIPSDNSSEDDFTIVSYVDHMQTISHQYEWTSDIYKSHCTVEDLATDAPQKSPTTTETTVEDLTTDAPPKKSITTEATSTDKTTNENLPTIIIAIVTPVASIFVLGFIIGLCLWCNRSRIRAFIERRRDLKKQGETKPLISRGRSWSSESIDSQIVRGIASLKGKIYLIFQDTSFIRVIGNTEEFVTEDNIELKAIKEPWSLEAYKNDDCLYIPDRKNKCIWMVNVTPTKRGLTTKICELHNPYKFSVASGGRLVIPIYPHSFQIRKSDDGSIERTIALPGNIIEPYYVLETASGSFVVGHGHEKNPRQGVCEVRLTKQDQCAVEVRPTEPSEPEPCTVEWSFPGDANDEIGNIDQLAMDEDGRIFVTDQNKGRILLLNKNGKKIDEVITSKLPYRLCYEPEKKQLLVGHYGAVSVYGWELVERLEGTHTEDYELQLQSMFECDRLPHSEIAERSAGPGRFEEQSTNMDIGDLMVSGIAELQGRLYVVFSLNNFIRVYSAVKPFKKESDKVVERLKDPFFITSCTINACLYITDKERRRVLKVGADWKKTEWDLDLEEPYRLSVISEGRVLIPRWSSQSLEMYDSNGRHLKCISLHSDIIEPLHAVELSEGVFAVSHGDKRSPHHRVCKITCEPESSTSEVTLTFGDERGGFKDEGQLNRPRSLAIDENGRVIIADAGNRRIVVLDAGWKTFTIVETKITPDRICYCKKSKQIFIGHFGTVTTVAARHPAILF